MLRAVVMDDTRKNNSIRAEACWSAAWRPPARVMQVERWWAGVLREGQLPGQQEEGPGCAKGSSLLLFCRGH